MNLTELEDIEKRRRSGWSDGKTFIFEDLIIYGLMFFVGSGLDVGLNFYHLLFNPGVRHPYNFGVFQIGLMVISTIQLMRSWDRWKYWR